MHLPIEADCVLKKRDLWSQNPLKADRIWQEYYPPSLAADHIIRACKDPDQADFKIREIGNATYRSDAAGALTNLAEAQDPWLSVPARRELAALQERVKDREPAVIPFRRTEDREEFSERIADKVLERFRGPIRRNFSGWLCARLVDGQGKTLPGEEGEALETSSLDVLQIEAWLEPQRPNESYYEPVEITDGEEGEAKFQIVVDCDGAALLPRSHEFSAKTGKPSQPQRFEFRKNPPKPGKYRLWISLLQGARLVQSVEIRLHVHKPGES